MERPRLCSNGFLKETFNDIESKLASQETHISDMNVANNYSGSFWDDGVKAKTGHFQKFWRKNKYSITAKQPNLSNKQYLKKESIVKHNSSVNKNRSEKNHLDEIENPRKEVSKSGSVNIQLYWKYIKAGASFLGITILLVSIIMSHGNIRFADSWLSIWTSNEILEHMKRLALNLNIKSAADNVNLKIQEFNSINYYYLVVYGSAVLGSILFTYVMIYHFFITAISASKNLHNQMFSRYFILFSP